MPKSAPWIAVGLVLLALVAAKFDARTGFTALIRFGAEWESRRMEQLAPVAVATLPGPGYDGQFYAQLALDPTALLGRQTTVHPAQQPLLLIPAGLHGAPSWMGFNFPSTHSRSRRCSRDNRW